ncbi:TPA: HNH endonuclease [Proteus mirabilis]
MHCPTGWVDPFGLAGGKGNKGEPATLIQKVNGRNPINSKYPGQVYPLELLPVEIRGKYPHSVPFTHAGFRDFSRYSIKNVRITPGNSRAVDFARADKLAGYSKQNPRPSDYTWHHGKESGYMQLVPTDIHGAVRHTGGIAKGK